MHGCIVIGPATFSAPEQVLGKVVFSISQNVVKENVMKDLHGFLPCYSNSGNTAPFPYLAEIPLFSLIYT